ncbi:MAG: HAD family phosphatase [Pseudomonadota bacterium]
MAIEAVVFDIGNVLVEWHPTRVFDKLLGEARRKELFSKVDFDGMNIRSDAGHDMWDGVEALAAAHPEDADDIRLWSKHWIDMFEPDLPRSVRMLRALRARGTPTYALSNFGDRTFDLGEEKFPFLKEFDQRFISARLGVIKPDPAIYEILERETARDPQTLLFIDDKQENIDAALARGWHGHQFLDEQGLALRLIAEGLLTEEEAA